MDLNAPWLQNAWATLAPRLPDIALALAILIGGWIAALVVRSAVFAGLRRTSIDDRIGEALGIENADDRIERLVSRGAYYLVLAFVLVAFFERLRVPAVTQPIVTALAGISSAVPSLLKAGLLAFVGYVAASLARRAVVAAIDRTGIVSRLESWSGVGDEGTTKKKSKSKAKSKKSAEPTAAAETIGNVVFWTLIVLTAIPVIEALKIGVLAVPLQTALSVVSTYLPKVVGAAVLAVVGYFLGRMARAALTAVIDRTGVDGALGRIGLGGVLGKQTVGGIVGNVAMVFIVLHFAISAVGRLDIKEISGPLGLTLQQIYAFLPNLLVAGVLLAIGVAVARVASRFARGVLAAIGFNTLMVHIGLFEKLSEEAAQQQEKHEKLLAERREKGVDGDAEVDPMLADEQRLQTPADIGGAVVGAVIVLLFVRQALETMGLQGLASMFDALLGYLPHVLVAAVVVGAGMWAGGWAKSRVADLIGTTDDPLLKALPTVVRVAIVAVAAMVALQQLGVGNQIIAIAFTLVLGAIALAFALAFGLGGREVAAKILDREYRKRSSR